jgi:hypothetical protein
VILTGMSDVSGRLADAFGAGDVTFDAFSLHPAVFDRARATARIIRLQSIIHPSGLEKNNKIAHYSVFVKYSACQNR